MVEEFTQDTKTPFKTISVDSSFWVFLISYDIKFLL